MWIRSRAVSALPTGLHCLFDRRALHGSAKHLVRGDRVHHLLEGRRFLVLLILGPVLIAHRGCCLLRVGAYRALHA